ncbi:hypothetical protein LSAT2_028782 [Lamellibrachia satsuma]|nr:hypothetical protein LSAT2_028782 [Lamellibrachia satsuma]
MRLGWAAMLCNVYELRHETSIGTTCPRRKISKLDLNRRYSMVRTYKRNSTQGSYGSFRLAVAVATVREGQSIRGTCADYGIPVSELQEMGTRRVHCGRPILHLPQL